MPRQRAFEAGTIEYHHLVSSGGRHQSPCVPGGSRAAFLRKQREPLPDPRPVRSSDKDSDKTPTDPKLWSELSEAQKQRYPSDWEAQESQGPITLHSEEHLGVFNEQVRSPRLG